MKKWVSIVFSVYLLMASSLVFAVAKQDVSARDGAKTGAKAASSTSAGAQGSKQAGKAAQTTQHTMGQGVGKTAVQEATQGGKPTLKQQALDIKKNLNKGKNRVTVETPNREINYDLDGAPHKGVETPHKQYRNPNIDPEGKRHLNKPKGNPADPMDQQDIRTIKKILEKRKD